MTNPTSEIVGIHHASVRAAEALGYDPNSLKNFKNFLWVIWDQLGLPEPTPVQYDVAEFLQHGPKRLVVEGYRGMGKSYITSALALFQLFLDPDKKIFVVSASKQRADDFSKFCQMLISETPLLQHLRAVGDQRWSMISFDVGPAGPAHAPSVKSVGITGQMTGSRADLIIADDIESLSNSMTQVMREKLLELIKEFDAILKPGGRIVYLGTPQTEESIYNSLPSRGYELRIWPARYPSTEWMKANGSRLAPMVYSDRTDDLVGQPTDPLRFGVEDLAEREMSYGRSGFALQFMLDTSLADAGRYPLKLHDLIISDFDTRMGPDHSVWSNDPRHRAQDLPSVGFHGDAFYRPIQVENVRFLEYQSSVMSIDPAGRGKDETAWSVVKLLNSQLYVPEVKGYGPESGYSPEVLEDIAQSAKRHQVKLILIEDNFGDGMFTSLLQPFLQRIYPCQVEGIRAGMMAKELRVIEALEPVMNQHKLVISTQVIREDGIKDTTLAPEQRQRYGLFYQMTRLTKERGCLMHDDRLESLANGVKHFTAQMGVAQEDHLQAQAAFEYEQSIQSFLDMVHKQKATARERTFLDTLL